MHRLLSTCHPSEPFASPGGEPRRMKDDEASMNSRNERIRRNCPSQDSANVVRSDPRAADRDPSRLGQLECIRGCGDWSPTRANRTALWLEWPFRRGIRTRYLRICNHHAELLTTIVSGAWRRNVLGAIADDKNDRNFPLRRQRS